MLLDESLYYFFLIVKERQPIRALNCAHTALTGSIANAKGSASRRTLCIEDWWRMTGSNRRPPACKAGALPAELIPQSKHNSRGTARHRQWWVWMDSNHRPP